MAVIASNSEANRHHDVNIYGTLYFGMGNTFKPTLAYTLTSAKFYLAKSGSPTGNCYAKLYAHTGTYGSSGTVTGAALGTSGAVDVSGLGAQALVTFTFSGADQYLMTANTAYCIVFEFSGGNSTNKVLMAVQSPGTCDGNNCYTLPAWSYSGTEDACFYVYGDAPAVAGGAFLNLMV